MSRVVMFVYNDAKRDVRVLREAAALVAAGHSVTIMARPSDINASVADREERDGFEIIRVPIPHRWRRYWIWLRYPWRARFWVVSQIKWGLRRGPSGWIKATIVTLVSVLMLPWAAVRALFYLAARLLRRHAPPGGSALDWLVRWRFGIVGWARAAAREAPIADVYHGHDLTGLPGAVRAASRNNGLVIYDSHELFIDSGSNARRPGWAREVLVRLEGRLSRRVTALVTVNQTLADELDRRYGFGRRVVVHNCPPRWNPPAEQPHLLAERLGLVDGERIVLYHGGFTPDRGLIPLAEAMLTEGLERAHLVYLGFGDMATRLRALAAEERFGGRLHVVDAVPPEELATWVASADVGVMPNQPSNANERLSTPNKLFESLAAGIPVVTSDFPERRRIVLDDPDGPLGEVCDPTDPRDIGRAIAKIISLPPAEMADLRRRCLKAAHERWNWESESARLVALYGDLTGQPANVRMPPVTVQTEPADAPLDPVSVDG